MIDESYLVDMAVTTEYDYIEINFEENGYPFILKVSRLNDHHGFMLHFATVLRLEVRDLVVTSLVDPFWTYPSSVPATRQAKAAARAEAQPGHLREGRWQHYQAIRYVLVLRQGVVPNGAIAGGSSAAVGHSTCHRGQLACGGNVMNHFTWQPMFSLYLMKSSQT